MAADSRHSVGVPSAVLRPQAARYWGLSLWSLLAVFALVAATVNVSLNRWAISAVLFAMAACSVVEAIQTFRRVRIEFYVDKLTFGGLTRKTTIQWSDIGSIDVRLQYVWRLRRYSQFVRHLPIIFRVVYPPPVLYITDKSGRDRPPILASALGSLEYNRMLIDLLRVYAGTRGVVILFEPAELLAPQREAWDRLSMVPSSGGSG